MIHLLPYLEERIISEKTPEEIGTVLQSVTARRGGLYTDPEFVGQVYPMGFKIAPVIYYRNSFLPVITGNITENESGTTIDITFRMRTFSRIAEIFWYVFFSVFLFLGILLVFAGELKGILFILFPVLEQISMRCFFYVPARKAFKRLKELLD